MPLKKTTWWAIVLGLLLLGSMGGMLLASTNPTDSKVSATNLEADYYFGLTYRESGG